MRFNLRSLIQVGIFFLLPVTLAAQRYPFISVSLKDGLPQSSVYGMVQDPTGYIWFSTGGGVCRYDGVEFTYYTYYSGLEAGHTQDIAIDQNGKLWVATFGKGLAWFDGKSFQCFNETNGFIYTHIKNLLFTKEGELWISVMDYGIVRIYNRGGVKLYWYEEIPKTVRTRKLSQLSNGDVVVGVTNGYYRFEKNNNYRAKLVEAPGVIIKMVEDEKGGLWMAGRDLLLYQLGDSIADRSSWLDPDFTVDAFDLLISRNDGLVYVATGAGVLKINGDRCETLTTANGLVDNYAMDLYEDRFGNIWVGTNDGASILNDRGMVHYQTDLKGGNLNTFTIAEHPNGNIHIGKSQLGYLISNDSAFFLQPLQYPGLFDPEQTYFRPTGEMYIMVNFSMIYRVVNDKLDWKWTMPDSITRLNCIFPLRDGHSILVGSSSGAFVLDEKTSNIRYIKNLDATNFVTAFYDHLGQLWICDDLGDVFLIKNLEATNWGAEINPEHDIIKHALYDHKHKAMWLATERGVLVWDRINTYKITTHNGLKSNLNYCITQDSLGRIWAGNLQGVDCIDVENKKVSHFGYEQGFLPIETNGRAAMTDSKGNVWIGAMNTASKIKVNELGKDTIEGVLRLQSIDVNEETWYSERYFDTLSPKINLKHDMNNLVFHVASICYTNAKNTVYEWKLEGFDKHLNKKANHREIEYSNLPPGTYKFRVKAVNPDGFVTNEIVVPIYIAKPFWQTGLFYASEIFIFILIVFLSFRFSKSGKNRFGQVMTLLTILIVFESIMLYISNYTDRYTHGIPVFQLVMNIVLAASLYPLEQRIKRIMQKRRRKK